MQRRLGLAMLQSRNYTATIPESQRFTPFPHSESQNLSSLAACIAEKQSAIKIPAQRLIQHLIGTSQYLGAVTSANFSPRRLPGQRRRLKRRD